MSSLARETTLAERKQSMIPTTGPRKISKIGKGFWDGERSLIGSVDDHGVFVCLTVVGDLLKSIVAGYKRAGCRLPSASDGSERLADDFRPSGPSAYSNPDRVVGHFGFIL